MEIYQFTQNAEVFFSEGANQNEMFWPYHSEAFGSFTSFATVLEYALQ